MRPICRGHDLSITYAYVNRKGDFFDDPILANSALELLRQASTDYEPAARRRPNAKTVSIRRLFMVAKARG
jgi:hypothetical protein